MAYCSAGDLLIGDIELSSTLSKESFLRDAFDEMNARLGFTYVLPLTGLPVHAVTLLKMINARLASGRLLMSVAAPVEDNGIHQYGAWLIKEAYADLMAIVNGQIVLVGAVSNVEPHPNAGTIVNHDAESAFEMFENNVTRATPSWWQPGDVRLWPVHSLFP